MGGMDEIVDCENCGYELVRKMKKLRAKSREKYKRRVERWEYWRSLMVYEYREFIEILAYKGDNMDNIGWLSWGLWSVGRRKMGVLKEFKKNAIEMNVLKWDN